MNIICAGLSHHIASIGLREKFAVTDADLARSADRLGAMDGISESVIISTCNRTELYAATEDSGLGLESLKRFLCNRAGEHHNAPTVLYQHGAPDSIRHLFRVVSGLDSMMLGETEILGQVKKAYRTAASNGKTARHLNKLFQRAFNVAKEVRTNTGITRGAVSVGAATVDLAEKIFGNLTDCKVMILGAGENSEMTLRTLFSCGVRKILISNRSYDRAAALAMETGGRAIPFGEWESPLREIDILIGSTAAPHPVLTRDKLAPIMAQRQNRPLFIIDLAMPRDVEPSVNELDGVYVYDIDSLRLIAEQSLELRRKELSVCDSIIERHVHGFTTWLTSVPARPAAGPEDVTGAIVANFFNRISPAL